MSRSRTSWRSCARTRATARSSTSGRTRCSSRATRASSRVVAILTPGRGGRALWRRETRARIASLRERLLVEVWLSVELGLSLHPVVPGELSVHIDANPVARHRSSAYVQELVGLVVSQGFRAVIKPESWAASRTADRMVRIAATPPATRPMAPGPAARPPHSWVGEARTAHGF